MIGRLLNLFCCGIILYFAPAVLLVHSCLAQTADAKTPEENSFRGIFSTGTTADDDVPLYIKSDSLSLDSKSRIFTYKDNVEIVRGDVRITADRMIGRYNEKNRLEVIVCEDSVVVTKGEDLRASSNRAVYRFSSSTVELTEEPELARDGNVLAADKITIFVDEDRSEAEGNVRVKVVKNDEVGGSTGSLSDLGSKLRGEENSTGPQPAAEAAAQ